MNGRRYVGSVVRWLAAGAGLAAASYAMCVATAWYRYGEVTHQATGEESDALLDRFGYKKGGDGYRNQPHGTPLVIRYVYDQAPGSASPPAKASS